jgi:hypothetical protein
MGLGKTLFVHDFEVERDGKIVKAEIKKSIDALNDYDDAISLGHTAVLGAIATEESDTFEMSCGNLSPGKTVTLRVFLGGAVEGNKDQLWFGLPADFFPKFGLNYKLNLRAKATFPSGIESMLVAHGTQV